MIQPSKNAGRLGARVEEARNQPRAGSSSRPSCRARPSVPGQQLAPQPRVVRPGRAGHAAARWGAQQRGEPRLSATTVSYTALFQQVRLLPRFQNFPHLLS